MNNGLRWSRTLILAIGQSSRLGIHCIALAMLAGVPVKSNSAESPIAEPGVSSPAKMHKASPEDLGTCYAATARGAGSEGKVDVIATIEPDGSISQVTLPPGIEPWQEETAQCVMKLLRFDAAVANGVPTRSQVLVPLNFSLPDEPVLVPPRLQPSSPQAVGRCYSRYARSTGQEGRLFVSITVEADGRVSKIDMPKGIEPWQEETAKCVLGVLKFHPGTVDGVPVAAQATMPLYFSLIGSPKFDSPKLVSTQPEQEDANQRCYPPDSSAIAQPQYRLTITRSGKATRITVVESTGDERLDQAGICLLKLLRFQPAMRGKAAVESTTVLPVILAPPK